MVVERTRGESQSTSGSLQSLCWGSSAFGGIVSSYFSGSLVGAHGVRYIYAHMAFISIHLPILCYFLLSEAFNTRRFVFGLTALLPLITSAVAVIVKEQPVLGLPKRQNLSGFLESSRSSIKQLWGAVRQPNVFLPTLFIFLWQATPQSDSAMFYFTYVGLYLLDGNYNFVFFSLLGDDC